jgi:DNA-directed RNA polymerase subunit F
MIQLYQQNFQNLVEKIFREHQNKVKNELRPMMIMRPGRRSHVVLNEFADITPKQEKVLRGVNIKQMFIDELNI